MPLTYRRTQMIPSCWTLTLILLPHVASKCPLQQQQKKKKGTLRSYKLSFKKLSKSDSELEIFIRKEKKKGPHFSKRSLQTSFRNCTQVAKQKSLARFCRGWHWEKLRPSDKRVSQCQPLNCILSCPSLCRWSKWLDSVNAVINEFLSGFGTAYQSCH